MEISDVRSTCPTCSSLSDLSPTVQDQLARLRRCPWLPITDSDSKTCFLMKFCADPEKEECYILVTDTVKVWAEAVQGRHISHRIPPTDYLRTEKQERRFRRHMLQLLHSAHQLCRLSDMQIVVEHGGKCADIALTVTTPSLNWQWRAFALHWSHAAQILSKQLIMPTITSMSVLTLIGSTRGARPPPFLQTYTLEFQLTPPPLRHQQLDKTAKTARITSHTHVRAVFYKPLVACGLVRVSQIWDHVSDEFLHPTVEDLEELDGVTAPLYFGEPISDDEPELESEPEHEHLIQANSPPLLRSSPAPLPDADGSGTEDEDDDDKDHGTGTTQIQTQPEGSVVGTAPRSLVSKTGSTRSQLSRYDGQSQASVNGNGINSRPSKCGQSQTRPALHAAARSQPHPSRSSAKLSMMSVSSAGVGAGGRSISQPQVAGSKRPTGSGSDSEDEFEREELLRRRMHGATNLGAIGMKKTTGRRKF
ncbi:hypothetical protein RHS02_04485, partial [Rhizoctonia solani]